MMSECEVQRIARQFIDLYAPDKLLLFGSQAKNTARRGSDIDLCVITETANKRSTLTDMYLRIDSDKPFDVILYTPDEWNRSIADHTSFAYHIHKEGVVLYG